MITLFLVYRNIDMSFDRVDHNKSFYLKKTHYVYFIQTNSNNNVFFLNKISMEYANIFCLTELSNTRSLNDFIFQHIYNVPRRLFHLKMLFKFNTNYF